MRRIVSWPAIFCISLVLRVPSRGVESGRWHKTGDSHIILYHEDRFLPFGLMMDVGAIYNRLRFDLGRMSPFVFKQPIRIYLYRDQQSYVNGGFNPPRWSNGIAIFEGDRTRIVALPNQKDKRKLLEVVAHEMTHLIFESYWHQKKKEPPNWLNEGLAVVEQAPAGHPERSMWYRMMADLPRRSHWTLEQLDAMGPSELNSNKKLIRDWYVQSYATVYFLFRERSGFQFQRFVSDLRDGMPLQDSLRAAYRYQSLASCDQALWDSLRDPALRARSERAEMNASYEPASGSDMFSDAPDF